MFKCLLPLTEAIVKIIGLRHHYFTVPWNLFDFILVFASIMGILLQDLLTNFPISPTLLRVVRVFRIGRILRLIKVNWTKGLPPKFFCLPFFAHLPSQFLFFLPCETGAENIFKFYFLFFLLRILKTLIIEKVGKVFFIFHITKIDNKEIIIRTNE